MSRMRLTLLSLLAVFAVSAVTSASASATCNKVAVAGTGTFSNNACTVVGGPKEYIKISRYEKELKAGEWCAKVATAGTGTYEDNACTKAKSGGEYIKVLATPRIFRDCADTGVGNTAGGFTNAGCTTAAPTGGRYARSRFIFGHKTELCLYVGENNGKYSTGECNKEEMPKAFEWFDPGVTVTVTGTNYTLEGELSGVKTKIKCEKLKAKEPAITSGEGTEPGKTEAEALEYSVCAVEKPAEKCVVASPGQSAGTIDTSAVDSELVENTTGEKIENRFYPKPTTKEKEEGKTEGKTFVKLEFKNKGTEKCPAALIEGSPFPIEGSSLTEVSPQEEEEGKGTLKSEPASKKYLNSEGKEREAKLTLGGNAATLAGSATVEVEMHAEKYEYKGKKIEVPAGKEEFGVW